MAYPGTTSYAGKLAAPYFSCALLELNSLSNGSLTVKLGLTGRTVVKIGATSGGLVAGSCDWAESAPFTFTERFLDPMSLMITSELCKEDFAVQFVTAALVAGDWEIENMGPSAHWSEPDGAVDFVITHLLAHGMAGLETMIWQGALDADNFDGFITLMTADGNVVDATATVLAGGLDASNIINEMSIVLAAAPIAAKSKPDFEFVLSYSAYEAYVGALGGFGAVQNVLATENVGGTFVSGGVNNQGPTFFNGQQLTFGGHPVRVANGMNLDHMVATNVSNLWFGTALMSDIDSTIKVLDMEDRDLSSNIRFKAKFVAGVQYGCSEDVVLYTPVTA